jgi:cytochrome c-type protein NapB
MPHDARHRHIRIGIAAALMLASVFVVGRSWRSAVEPALVPESTPVVDAPLASEAGVFARSSFALDYERSKTTPSTRTRAQFLERRAYPGGPPIIPHPLADPTSYGGQTCLACHEDGGWVDKWKAFAPVTPHPTLTNCVQCHVVNTGARPFRASTFVRPAPPAIGQAALPGSPPAIPHDTQLRENCLACHAGPGAVRELRVTHPERGNCRQCHVPGSRPVAPFVRSAQGPGGGGRP